MTALFAGTFDPFTIGHLSVVERGLQIFDRIIVAVGINASKPGAAEKARETAEAVRRALSGNPRVEVATYSGLTVDAAKELGADCLLRGVRDTRDFEYERNLADVNRNISGIETVFIPTEPQLAWVSSSVVRELRANGRDVTPLLAAEKTSSEK